MGQKLKTNKSLAKRLKITKTGKAIHQKAGRSHLLTNKNKSHRKDKSGRQLADCEMKKVKNLIPYKY